MKFLLLGFVILGLRAGNTYAKNWCVGAGGNPVEPGICRNTGLAGTGVQVCGSDGIWRTPHSRECSEAYVGTASRNPNMNGDNKKNKKSRSSSY